MVKVERSIKSSLFVVFGSSYFVVLIMSGLD